MAVSEPFTTAPAELEPVSPELVLVDPLATEARASLAEPGTSSPLELLLRTSPTNPPALPVDIPSDEETAAALQRILEVADLEPPPTPRWSIRLAKSVGAVATWVTVAILVVDVWQHDWSWLL